MAMVGDLQEFSLPDLLQLIERGSKTGQLSVWAPNGIYRIWFYQGRIIAAVPPEKEHHLEQLLANSGFSSDRVVAKLASLCPLNEPLGICLQRQDLIAPPALAKLFRQQLRMGLYSLFSLEGGQFSFTANAPMPYGEMTGLSKGSTAAIMEGLRLLETSQKPVEDLPQPDDRFFRTSHELPLFKLSTLEWSIWEQVSPYRKLHDIAQLLHADLLEVRRAAARLKTVGLIDLYTDKSTSSQLTPKEASVPAQPLPTSPVKSRIEGSPEPISSSLLSRLASVLRGIR
ncbi:MAG: DUF4388 domain-containing protein [Cyanobacteriota bacterium]|nr:DUF4388 domain-containing protein [Cyanobacteriota bacterium]